MASTLCLFNWGRDHRQICWIDLGSLTAVAVRDYPLGWEYARLLGSRRGQLCIYNPVNENFALWNPATGSCRLLPSAPPLDRRVTYYGLTCVPMKHDGEWDPFGEPFDPYDFLDCSACVYGFGYEDRNREYVLLRLSQTWKEPNEGPIQEPIQSTVNIYRLAIQPPVNIYRSRVNTWRGLQGMSYYLVDPYQMGVFVEGHMHWIMRREWAQDSAKVLVAFDIYTESFVEMGLPNLIDQRRTMELAVLGGCLCLIYHCEGGNVRAWIMREYGLNGSWHRLFWIRQVPLDRPTVQPLAYSRDDRQVLVRWGMERLFWYDLRTHEVEEFHIDGRPAYLGEVTCLRL